MKDRFYEFYKLPKDKVESIWEKGLLVTDTNVLLDLYRLEENSRKDLKKSIDYFKDRIWLPYQVGLEFHRNRESVIKELGGSKYESFKKQLNDVTIPKALESLNSFKRHPCINYSYIEKAFDKLKNDLEKKLVDWEKQYPFNVDDDEILHWVTEKFDGKIGEDNSEEELLALYKDGLIRYQAEVPPGYKDVTQEKKEAGKRYVYGDLIIWKAVIRKAKEDKVDIIFLTNDNKEDWYEKEKGQTKGPRFELLREFHKESEQDVIIMSEAAFLKETKERTSIKVKDSSIKDAEQAFSHLPSVLDLTRPYNTVLPYGSQDYYSLFPKDRIVLNGSADALSYFDPLHSMGGSPSAETPYLIFDEKTGLMRWVNYSEYLSSRLPHIFGDKGDEEK